MRYFNSDLWWLTVLDFQSLSLCLIIWLIILWSLKFTLVYYQCIRYVNMFVVFPVTYDLLTTKPLSIKTATINYFCGRLLSPNRRIWNCRTWKCRRRKKTQDCSSSSSSSFFNVDSRGNCLSRIYHCNVSKVKLCRKRGKWYKLILWGLGLGLCPLPSRHWNWCQCSL